MAARSYPPISVAEPVRAEGGIDGAGGGWVVTESGTATIGDSRSLFYHGFVISAT